MLEASGPLRAQQCAKLAILDSKLIILGTSWRQDARRIAIKMEPHMRSKSHLGPSWRQEVHRGPQKCPWYLNFQWFFLEFWTAPQCMRIYIYIYIYLCIYIYILFLSAFKFQDHLVAHKWRVARNKNTRFARALEGFKGCQYKARS